MQVYSMAPASLRSRWAMSGLRGKLLVGFGGLLFNILKTYAKPAAAAAVAGA